MVLCCQFFFPHSGSRPLHTEAQWAQGISGRKCDTLFPYLLKILLLIQSSAAHQIWQTWSANTWYVISHKTRNMWLLLCIWAVAAPCLHFINLLDFRFWDLSHCGKIIYNESGNSSFLVSFILIINNLREFIHISRFFRQRRIERCSPFCNVMTVSPKSRLTLVLTWKV